MGQNQFVLIVINCIIDCNNYKKKCMINNIVCIISTINIEYKNVMDVNLMVPY